MKKIYTLLLFSILTGILHAQDGFGTYIRDVIRKQEKGILVTARLIEACGLCDSLDILMDYEYEYQYRCNHIPESYSYNGNTFYSPESRKYGYTLFAESDEMWEKALGKSYKQITPQEVLQYIKDNEMYNDDANTSADSYEDKDNILNQFVTYHLLGCKLGADKIVRHGNERGFFIYTKRPAIAKSTPRVTMGKRRILYAFESRQSNGIYLNRFPLLDNGRNGTYHELSCAPEDEGVKVDTASAIYINNAAIYMIDRFLAYDRHTVDKLSGMRIRYNISEYINEFENNDIVQSKNTSLEHSNVYIPSYYPYLEDFQVAGYTYLCYQTGTGKGWPNYNSDEFCISGLFDVTLRLPPVPSKGIYELRLKQQAGATMMTIAQFYIGTDKDDLKPIGMPLDLRQGTTRSGIFPSFIGWKEDCGDEYIDQMTDNEMHENGFMKGPYSICAGGSGTVRMERGSDICFRRIICRQVMDPEKTYYLRVRNVIDNTNLRLYLDYLELCPKSVYDNPEVPEDIW